MGESPSPEPSGGSHVDASHGRGVVIGDHATTWNLWMQDRKLDASAIEALSPHAGANQILTVPPHEAVVLLAGMSVDASAAVVRVLLVKDEQLAVSLLADMNGSRARDVVAALPAWLADLPAAADTIAHRGIGARSTLGARIGTIVHTGPSVRGTHGFSQRHDKGWVHWTARGGVQLTTGAVAGHHESLGGPAGRLGFPLCPVIEAKPSPSGSVGRWQRFEGSFDYGSDVCERLELRCGATVYHSPTCGTHATWGGIGEFYERAGATGSRLGFPVTDECEIVSGRGTSGWFQRFEAGVVYFVESAGAAALDHDVAECHERHGGVAGVLGFPVGPASAAPESPFGTSGRFQRFEGAWDYPDDVRHGAAIFVSEHGAHPVRAGIGEYYEQLGGPESWLGFPSSGETDARVSDEEWCCFQTFEGGTVFWKEAYGAVAVSAPTARILSENRRLAQRLGVPTGRERPLDGNGTMQFFEHGVVTVRDGTAEAWVRPSAATPPPASARPVTDRPTGSAVTRTRLDGHRGGYDVAFSPDTTLVAVARGSGGVEVWKRRTGERVSVFRPGHDSFLTRLAFRDDGRVLAAGGVEGTVWLWDTATGDDVGGPVAGSAGSVNALTFSPRGNLIIGRGRGVDSRRGPAGEVQLWDPVAARDFTHPVGGGDANIMSVAVSAGGRWMAVGKHDGTVQLIDYQESLGGEILSGHDGFVTALAFSPDTTLLATGDHHGTIRLWNVGTRTPAGEPLTGHDRTVDELTFDPDGRLLASAGRDRTVRFWDPLIGRPIGGAVTDHGGYAHALTFRSGSSMLAVVTPIHTEDGQDLVGNTEICRFPLDDVLRAQVTLLHHHLHHAGGEGSVA